MHDRRVLRFATEITRPHPLRRSVRHRARPSLLRLLAKYRLNRGLGKPRPLTENLFAHKQELLSAAQDRNASERSGEEGRAMSAD